MLIPFFLWNTGTGIEVSGFENYDEATRAIELEIERKGVILGIDWTDDVQVRLLAREALLHAAEEAREMAMSEHPDPLQRAKVDLFGLAAIMLRTLQESAQSGRTGLEGLWPGTVGGGDRPGEALADARGRRRRAAGGRRGRIGRGSSGGGGCRGAAGRCRCHACRYGNPMTAGVHALDVGVVVLALGGVGRTIAAARPRRGADQKA